MTWCAFPNALLVSEMGSRASHDRGFEFMSDP